MLQHRMFALKPLASGSSLPVRTHCWYPPLTSLTNQLILLETDTHGDVTAGV